jgi:hypothetical protein
MTFDQNQFSDNTAKTGESEQRSVADNLYQSAYEHLMPVRGAQENRNAINAQTDAPVVTPQDNRNALDRGSDVPIRNAQENRNAMDRVNETPVRPAIPNEGKFEPRQRIYNLPQLELY